MAIAKVKLDDLIEFERKIETFIGVLKETQEKVDTLEKADNDIRKEIDEYEQASKKCNQIISEVNKKLSQLETKERRLEQEIKLLKAEIQAVKAEIMASKANVAMLSTELVTAPPPLKVAVAEQLHQAKASLHAAEARKNELEKKLDQTEKELERTKRNIETIKNLINQLEQKQSQIQDSINALNEASENLRNAINELNDLLQKLTGDSQCALDNLSKSDKCINRYLEIGIDNIEFNPRGSVMLRKCINLQYAGEVYDYSASRDDNGQLFTQEKVRYFQEKYPDIKYSEIDSYGNTYPDFSRFEKYSYKFPSVTKDNLVSGTCLIGDSKGGSADFRKFRESMENAGYSKQQIAELLSTHTIHHDEDGCTLRLIPRDVHKACRHNGGAEKIRLQIAML